MTTAYPLSWPDHIDRHRTREQGRFKTSLSSALRASRSSPPNWPNRNRPAISRA